MARLRDGFSTLIGFANAPNIKFWEITVKPPGLDGGGPNDTTTMRNTALRTMQPKKLYTVTPISGTCAYDPAVYDDVKAIINVNQQITIYFADGSTRSIWGYLDKFEPNECKEGEQPTAAFTVQPTNQNNSYVEQTI